MNTTAVEAFSNSSQIMSNNSDGAFLSAIYSIFNRIAQTVLDADSNGATGFQVVVIVLAIFGFFSLLMAVISKIGGGVGAMFQILVVVPMIIILSLVNKKNRKERKEQLKQLREEAMIQNKKIKKFHWFLFILKIVILPLILIAVLIWTFVI